MKGPRQDLSASGRFPVVRYFKRCSETLCCTKSSEIYWFTGNYFRLKNLVRELLRVGQNILHSNDGSIFCRIMDICSINEVNRKQTFVRSYDTFFISSLQIFIKISTVIPVRWFK